MLDALTLYVILVLFFATLIRSAIGFGEALVAVPLLALKLPLTTAAPLAVLVSVTVALIVIVQDWRHIHFRSAAGLLAATLVGIPVGLFLLLRTSEILLIIALAAFLIAYALYSLLAKTKLHLKKDHPGWLLACGFFAGVLGGSFGMNGPPLAIYGALRRWSPQHFRATLQAYFLPASLLGLVGYLATGLWNETISRLYFISLVPVIAAVLLGRSVNKRLRGDQFLIFVYLMLIAIGMLLLVKMR